MKVRIGIDVGGTFTDAVLIDAETYALIGFDKIQTTHTSKQGVADGIIQVIKKIMAEYKVRPEDVVFIAHGTTQATNALLEGDVSRVGIISLGHGAGGIKVRLDTELDDIELAKEKFLKSDSAHIDTANYAKEDIAAAIRSLRDKGCEAFVAASAFSVDNPEYEDEVMACLVDMGLVGTATHEISKLYGLKMRTRTAAVNASILPRMIQTADMTRDSVLAADIRKPLMIMRCDGGVMDINEVKKRPILTMLSGPAAGVAGALMYEKVSNGIFLEVGGTSTDISAIKNGKVMIDYAQIGNNKTYLRSLDVRTVGIAGGSMVRVADAAVADVGPRSAHIAQLDYSVFATPDEITDPRIELFSPRAGDPADYLAVSCANGKRFAVTTTCAANLLGYVKPADYAYGNPESVRRALRPLAEKWGRSVEEIAREILDVANRKNEAVVRQLIKDYEIPPEQVILIGGGGGCAAIVPHLAGMMGLPTRNCKNASVISPIGVALAMVRDVVERTILNPTEADILSIRQEALQAAIRQGANPESVDIQIEVDAKKNVLRATAAGTTELRARELSQAELGDEEILDLAARTLSIPAADVAIVCRNREYRFVTGSATRKKLFGLVKSTTTRNLVIGRDGVIRIQAADGQFFQAPGKNALEHLEKAIDGKTIYGDANMIAPDVYVFYGGKIFDYSGVIEKAQILTLAKTDLRGIDPEGTVEALIIAKKE